MAKVSTFSHGLKWGIITALVVIIYNVIVYVLGLYHNPMLGLLFFPLFFIFAFLAVKGFRDSNGSMSVGQGLLIGSIVGLITGLLWGIYTHILTTIIDPNILKESIEASAEMMYKFGMDEDAVDSIIEQSLENPPSAAKTILGSLFFQTILGFFCALVPAFVFKRDYNRKY